MPHTDTHAHQTKLIKFEFGNYISLNINQSSSCTLTHKASRHSAKQIQFAGDGDDGTKTMMIITKVAFFRERKKMPVIESNNQINSMKQIK